MHHDFTEMDALYPDVIDQMADTFTSHEFILRLAQQHQRLYVEALYSYRDSVHRGQPTPFRALHGILSQRLHIYPDMVTYLGQVQSVDIFGHTNECAQWQRH